MQALFFTLYCAVLNTHSGELGRELGIDGAFVKADTAFFAAVLRAGFYFKGQKKHASLLDSSFGERNDSHAKLGLYIKTDHISCRLFRTTHLEDLHELYRPITNLL